MTSTQPHRTVDVENEHQAPILVRSLVATGPRGPMLVCVRCDHDAAPVRAALIDPDHYVPPPTRPSHVRKQKRRRAVHSFPAPLDGVPARFYLKLYRVRTLKDVCEELLLGTRARRSFEAALEAERRGIAVPTHFGWSAPHRHDRVPAPSFLLSLGVPHDRDARSTLDTELGRDAAGRARLLRAAGRFIAQAHARGLVHGDLKLGNVFVLELDPPRLVLLDFDRARFRPAPHGRVPLGQMLDLRTLLRSTRRLPVRERQLLLGAWLGERDLARPVRMRLLRALRASGAW